MDLLKQGPKVKYEDNHLLVLSKPAGMPTVPDSSKDVSLLDLGKKYLKNTRKKQGNVFLAVVHRLDRPVSGLVTFAITSKAASRLSKQLREKKFKKKYLAVIKADNIGLKGSRGVIDEYLKKDFKRNRVEIVKGEIKNAKRAITTWQILEKRDDYILLELCPVTGRPHQLRVHVANRLFAPIVGDFKYGSKIKVFKGRGLALHSYSLEFFHPTKKELLVFRDSPPNYYPFSIFSDLLKSIANQ